MKILKNLAKRILRKEIEQDLLQKKDLEFEVSELKKQVHYLRKVDIELSKSVWQEILYFASSFTSFINVFVQPRS